MKRCACCDKEVEKVYSVTNKKKKKVEGLCIDCAQDTIGQ